MKEEALDKVELRKEKEIIDKVSSKIFPIILKKDEISIINELDKNEYSDVDLTLCIDTAHNNNTILTTLVNLNLSRAVNYFISIVKSYKKLYSELKSYINKENSKGYNALLYSAFRGNLQVFTTLMENGADINSVTSSSGLNALHLAAQGNYPNIIIYLIEKYGMNINSQDNKGNSALHWAVYMDKKQAVDYLIYYNIDTNLRDNDNDTALDIAKRRGNKLFVKLFQEDYVLLNKKK
jgi:ankyrin repeat protein